jgi:hypothetical protein
VNAKEEIAIRKWHESLSGPIQLALILTESDQNERFNDYGAAFAQIAPAVEIRKEKKDTADPPSFRIGSNIFYHALPQEKELDPFLEILSQIADQGIIETYDTGDDEKIRSQQNYTCLSRFNADSVQRRFGIYQDLPLETD